jgi:hypothetical protein
MDKTNRLHLEKKWSFSRRAALGLSIARYRTEFAVTQVFRPRDSRSDIEKSPPLNRPATTAWEL